MMRIILEKEKEKKKFPIRVELNKIIETKLEFHFQSLTEQQDIRNRKVIMFFSDRGKKIDKERSS